MCLSTVYKKTAAEPVLFCKNIQSVHADPEAGKLTFTDIMGIRYEVLGQIEHIDLVDNVIEVREK